MTTSAVSPAAPPRPLRPVLPRYGFRLSGANNWRPSWLGICPVCAEHLAAKRRGAQESLAAAGALTFPKGARP